MLPTTSLQQKAKSVLRRRKNEIGEILSAAQCAYLRPILISKINDPEQSISYSHLLGLGLFREFRGKKRHLEVLVRAELKNLHRVVEVARRQSQRNVDRQEKTRAAEDEARESDVKAALRDLAATHAQELDTQRKKHEEAMAGLHLALRRERTLREYEADAHKNEHQVAIEASRVAYQQETRRLVQVVEDLRASESQLEIAIARCQDQHDQDLDHLRDKHHRELRRLSEMHHVELHRLTSKYEDLKAELHAVWQDAETQRGQLLETQWDVQSTKQALEASQTRGEILAKENFIYRAGPDIETRMRKLSSMLRNVARDATMEEVRHQVACLYIDAYKIVHGIEPRWLKIDVEEMMRDWWVGRCQLAHKTDHRVDLDTYRILSQRVIALLDDVDAVLNRGARQIELSVGPRYLSQNSDSTRAGTRYLPPSKPLAARSMADFTDDEDKLLVQLAYSYQSQGARIAWKHIESVMQKSASGANKLTASKLKMRLKTLTNRFGRSLASFPPRFFQPASNKNRTTDTAPTDANNLHDTTLLAEFERILRRGGHVNEFDADTRPSSTVYEDRSTSPMRTQARRVSCMSSAAPLAILSSENAQALSGEIFKCVTRAEVRQARQEDNVGELLGVGVSCLVTACLFTSDDVFVDIGSGVGNVIAQVALESAVKMAIGIELRSVVALKGQRLIREWASEYTSLHRVRVIPCDIRSVELVYDIPFKSATVVFCHNTLFNPTVQQDIEHLCCQLSMLRIVVVQTPVCPRHKPRCLRQFCAQFSQSQIMMLPVSFTAALVPFTVYNRTV